MTATTWSLKIVILGEPNVGKTSLRRTYLGENFEENYLSTIGADFSYKKLTIEKGMVNAAIWDLAGQILYKNVNEQYFRGAAGAMVVYDVTKDLSFERIPEWIDKYLQNSGNIHSPILIIGNKTDLLKDEALIKSELQQKTLVNELREKYSNVSKFMSFRTSAKTEQNVVESFSELVKEIIDFQLNSSDLVVKIPPMSEINEYLPVAYLIGLHDVYGPKIISKSGISENQNFTNQEMSSAIKTASILDSSRTEENSQKIGIFPWSDPSGSFVYISFSVDEPKMKANNALFILGFVANRALGDIISGNRSIIDGYLHKAMNSTILSIGKLETEVISSSNISMKPDDTLVELKELLKNTRKGIFEILRKKIK